MEEDKNYISLIHGDLTRATQVQHGMPDSIGVMSIKTANRTILEASLLPTPRALWDSFWYEGELSCLFADSNVGKSILAVQIADRIARTDNVLYLDFELSEKQFQLRYTNEHGKPYTFPERLYRVSLDCNSLLEADFEEAIMGGIEQMALQTGCKIFIVDNLTYLCCAMEKGDAAGRLMIQLNNLKKKYGLSVLVLAHTPKRSLDCPITSNDLAGSKRLYNFFDSVFAIGKSAQDGGLRYVKQLKVRYGTFSHDADNVIIYEIEKVDAFLREHNCSEQIREGYGTTECVTASCLTPKDYARQGSIGVPFPDTFYKIVEPGTTNEAEANIEGEICISGPTVMLGYMDNPEETRQTLRRHYDGRIWLHTGDLGHMDQDGFVYFRQRIKRMIITSGYNVYPSQLENIIDGNENVLLSCVIGVKDPYKMQKVKAFVVLKPGVAPTEAVRQDLMAYCRKRIAKYAMPYEIEFREELPKTLVGKVAYRVLEEEAEKEQNA